MCDIQKKYTKYAQKNDTQQYFKIIFFLSEKYQKNTLKILNKTRISIKKKKTQKIMD